MWSQAGHTSRAGSRWFRASVCACRRDAARRALLSREFGHAERAAIDKARAPAFFASRGLSARPRVSPSADTRAVTDRARLQTRREDVSNGSAAQRRGGRRLDRVRRAEEPLPAPRTTGWTTRRYSSISPVWTSERANRAPPSVGTRFCIATGSITPRSRSDVLRARPAGPRIPQRPVGPVPRQSPPIASQSRTCEAAHSALGSSSESYGFSVTPSLRRSASNDRTRVPRWSAIAPRKQSCRSIDRLRYIVAASTSAAPCSTSNAGSSTIASTARATSSRAHPYPACALSSTNATSSTVAARTVELACGRSRRLDAPPDSLSLRAGATVERTEQNVGVDDHRPVRLPATLGTLFTCRSPSVRPRLIPDSGRRRRELEHPNRVA